MFEKSPVTVHVSRAEVHRTPNGGDAIAAGDPRGTVLVGQSGDVQVAMADRVTLTVWPNGTVTLTTPAHDGYCDCEPSGITFELPDRDVIGNGVTAIPVRYL